MRLQAFVSVICVLAVGALLAAPAVAQEPTVQELAQKVEALEKRLATLEQNLTRQISSLERQLAQAGASTKTENEAQASLREVQQLASSGDLDKAKTAMAEFMKKYGSTNTAGKARRLQQELAVVGKQAPADWSSIQKWFQGESDINLAGGKTTLFVFWELWCPHCKREVPKLEQLYTSLKDDGLQVVGLTKLTKNTTEEALMSFVEQSSVHYPVAKEDGSLSRYFNVSGVPAAAVMKDGIIVWRGHPSRLSESMIKKWL
jgi:thiol-disulfide isomerase/thioredoxin